MFERIKRWLFPKITQYSIAPAARLTMQSFAQQTHPKEAFAVLRGKHEKNTLVITELIFQQFTNTTRSATAAIDRYAISGMSGTFHSHPIPNAEPSAADKRLFAKHPGVHCISAYPYREVHVYNQSGVLVGIESIAFQKVRRRQ